MQFLYSDGIAAHMMEMETYEQLELPQDLVADELRWIKPNEEIEVLYVDDAPSGIQLPASVELEVTETDPGLKGDTVSGGGEKPATLETGVTVKVPLFVNVGDRVKVQTASGAYVSRV
jgi:elongation factor P